MIFDRQFSKKDLSTIGEIRLLGNYIMKMNLYNHGGQLFFRKLEKNVRISNLFECGPSFSGLNVPGRNGCASFADFGFVRKCHVTRKSYAKKIEGNTKIWQINFAKILVASMRRCQMRLHLRRRCRLRLALDEVDETGGKLGDVNVVKNLTPASNCYLKMLKKVEKRHFENWESKWYLVLELPQQLYDNLVVWSWSLKLGWMTKNHNHSTTLNR